MVRDKFFVKYNLEKRRTIYHYKVKDVYDSELKRSAQNHKKVQVVYCDIIEFFFQKDKIGRCYYKVDDEF